MTPEILILLQRFFSDFFPPSVVISVADLASASTSQESTLPGTEGLKNFIFCGASPADNFGIKTDAKIINGRIELKRIVFFSDAFFTGILFSCV